MILKTWHIKIRAWKANQVFNKLRLGLARQKHGCARRGESLIMMTRVHTPDVI